MKKSLSARPRPPASDRLIRLGSVAIVVAVFAAALGALRYKQDAPVMEPFAETPKVKVAFYSAAEVSRLRQLNTPSELWDRGLAFAKEKRAAAPLRRPGGVFTAATRRDAPALTVAALPETPPRRRAFRVLDPAVLNPPLITEPDDAEIPVYDDVGNPTALKVPPIPAPRGERPALFRLDRRGRRPDLRLLGSSGDPEFDRRIQAALLARVTPATPTGIHLAVWPEHSPKREEKH